MRQSEEQATEDEVREAFRAFPELWDELFPAEQERLLQLLTDRVGVHEDGLDTRIPMEFRTYGGRKLMIAPDGEMPEPGRTGY